MSRRRFFFYFHVDQTLAKVATQHSASIRA
jgi:hypothetical protein